MKYTDISKSAIKKKKKKGKTKIANWQKQLSKLYSICQKKVKYLPSNTGQKEQ